MSKQVACLKKRKKVVDQESINKEFRVPDRKKPAFIKPIKDPTLHYNSIFGRKSGRTSFYPPEYNLAEIQRVEDVESYVRQSFNKKIALMFKEGYDFVGKNSLVVQYIRVRFAQIARASGIPTKKLIRDIGSGLIKKSNVFLIKVRDIKSSGGKIRKALNSSKEIEPIAGYFIAPAETIEFQLSGNKVVTWRQRMPNGDLKPYLADNVVHMYYDRKDGFVFGTPLLVPVIDDIRALRKIEENIEILIYQHLFPLFQWKVGTKESPATVTEKGEREVDVIKEEIQYMPSEGGIVTTERHEITAIGAEGRALRAEGYLGHFKKRVFAGLGHSSVDFGEGETVNRSTSETLSQNLIDSVKDLQQIIEVFINEYVINELLLESNFRFDVMDAENKVELKFKEIDLDMQIKKENHYADQFSKNIMTHAEARIGQGKEPILLPTPEEIDSGNDGPDKFPDWYALKWIMIMRPTLLIQSLDEPYTNLSKARTAAEIARKDELQVKKQRQIPKGVKSTVEKSLYIKDAFLVQRYNKTKQDIVDYMKQKTVLDKELVAKLIRASLDPAINKLIINQVSSYTKGYLIHNSTQTDQFIRGITAARMHFRNRAEKYVNRLINDLTRTILRNIKVENDMKDSISVVLAAFDSFAYRTRFIEDVEFRKAMNLGQSISLRDLGFAKLIPVIVDKACDKCQNHLDIIIDSRLVTIEDVPPYHPGCKCGINSFVGDLVEIENSVEKKKDYGKNIEDKKVSNMVKCRQKMLRNLKKMHPELTDSSLDSLVKIICQESFIDGIESKNKLERCVLKVKKSLRKQHPEWSFDKVKQTAFKVCNSRIKK